ncbi:MAG: helix-turn-helix transcriptional regulator, partial [Clostridiales bacterium]|nr:helix-turn-helix transcriptional regulator [Clostridiales bacterium]
MDIKENLAKNLTRFRKLLNLTQAELAEKLNYSDKAVSKWERGESVPDITVLKQLADFYGTTIDDLISEPKPIVQPKRLKDLPKKRFLICALCTGLVWLVAIVAFAFVGIIFPDVHHTWLAFIYAVPITLIILLVLTSVWGKSLTNAIITSALVWTLILSVYLTILMAVPTPPK